MVSSSKNIYFLKTVFRLFRLVPVLFSIKPEKLVLPKFLSPRAEKPLGSQNCFTGDKNNKVSSGSRFCL